MDYCGTGKVNKTHPAQPPRLVMYPYIPPDPVTKYGINHAHHHDRAPYMDEHPRPLGHSPGKYSGGRPGEYYLEEGKGEAQRDLIHVHKAEVTGAYKPCLAIPEHQAKTSEEVGYRGYYEHYDVLYGDVYGILRLDETGLQGREAYLHKEDHTGRYHQPYDVRISSLRRSDPTTRGKAAPLGIGTLW